MDQLSDASAEAVAATITSYPVVEPTSASDVHRQRSQWARQARRSRRAHLAQPDGLRASIAHAIAARTWPARVNLATLAGIAGASRAEVLDVLRVMEDEGVVTLRATTTPPGGVGPELAALADSLDVVTDDLLGRLVGATE